MQSEIFVFAGVCSSTVLVAGWAFTFIWFYVRTLGWGKDEEEKGAVLLYTTFYILGLH